MKMELYIIIITGFLIYNTYHDNKYLKQILSWKKYYTMAAWGFIGLSLYILMKRSPSRSRELMVHLNKFIQYMPIDKQAKHLFNPVFNMTASEDRILQSGGGGGGGITHTSSSSTGRTKRSVSETKKKYVAASQNWLCGKCNTQLPAWFEVDHRTRLDQGGSNHVSNLVALCRNCHGEKTALENL
tara:strand:+ start:1086 stop:1640 length:555 start_codon:yes stop_codon:yes gene_type:complete